MFLVQHGIHDTIRDHDQPHLPAFPRRQNRVTKTFSCRAISVSEVRQFGRLDPVPALAFEIAL